MQITKASPPAFAPHQRGKKYQEVYDAVASLQDGEYLRVDTGSAPEKKSISNVLRHAAKARGREMKIRTEPDLPLVMWACLLPLKRGTDA